MLIIKKPNNKVLKEVAKQLRAGAVVVYPTDTAYGLGCDATNAKAVAKIFKIKSRDAKKALPVICADVKMVKIFFGIVHRSLFIVHKHWPGPLSIVLKAKKGIAKATLHEGTAAVRVPDSDIARLLSKYLGRPLVATSANISGQPACYSVRGFLEQFRRQSSPVLGRGLVIIDAGALRRRRPSTIVKIDESGKVEVLRKGPIKFVPQ